MLDKFTLRQRQSNEYVDSMSTHVIVKIISHQNSGFHAGRKLLLFKVDIHGMFAGLYKSNEKKPFSLLKVTCGNRNRPFPQHVKTIIDKMT